MHLFLPMDHMSWRREGKLKWKIQVPTNTAKITTVCSEKDDAVTLLKAALRLLRRGGALPSVSPSVMSLNTSLSSINRLLVLFLDGLRV